MNEPYLETKRLRIRRFSMADLEASYLMNLDPKVSQYTGDGGVVSKQELARRIRLVSLMSVHSRDRYGLATK